MPTPKAPDHATILQTKSRGRPAGKSGARTRERIVQTAASLFSVKGFEHVSMNEIAGACGITGAAIYNYFPSKDLLFGDVVCTMYTEIETAFAGPLTSDLGLWDALDAVLDICLEIYREDEVLGRLGHEAALVSIRSPGRFPEFAVAQQRIDDLFIDAVRRGVARGELPPETDVEETGAVLESQIMAGLSSRSLKAPSAAQFRRTIETFRMLLRQMKRNAPNAQGGHVAIRAVPKDR